MKVPEHHMRPGHHTQFISLSRNWHVLSYGDFGMCAVGIPPDEASACGIRKSLDRRVLLTSNHFNWINVPWFGWSGTRNFILQCVSLQNIKTPMKVKFKILWQEPLQQSLLRHLITWVRYSVPCGQGGRCETVHSDHSRWICHNLSGIIYLIVYM